MVPTALALSLRPRLKQFLGDADALVRTSSVFDPAETRRTFMIGTSDFVTAVIFTPLLARLAVAAPGISFDLVQPSDATLQSLESGATDLLVMPAEHISPIHPSELLIEERHVVVGCGSNPLFARSLTLDDFLASGHVAVELGGVSRASFAEQHLKQLALERAVEVRVSSFTVVPQLVVGTKRLAVMHERLAHTMRKYFPISISPMPIELPPMREMLQHHRSRSEDAGLRWLIEEMREIIAREGTEPNYHEN
jgi:DNA-binding transcriptional LysR family regulator